MDSENDPQGDDTGFDTPAAAQQDVDPPDLDRLPNFERSGELRWQDLVVATRTLLLKSGRIPASVFLDKWDQEYSCSLQFPIFGIDSLPALLRELQPGALTIVERSGTVMQASGDGPYKKEQAKWGKLEPTATKWLLQGFEKDLKATQQSLAERRVAQKSAKTQVDAQRQEYQTLQKNQGGGKSALLRSAKADLDKAEQRLSKFAAQAEELETKEKHILEQIAQERKAASAPVPPRSASNQAPQAAEPSRQTQQPTSIAPVQNGSSGYPQAADDDFM